MEVITIMEKAYIRQLVELMVTGGTKYDGSYLGVINTEIGHKEGNYVLSRFSVGDGANNNTSFSANVSSSNGVVTRNWSKEASDVLGGIDISTLSFTVSGERNNQKTDTSLPAITNLSISKPINNGISDLHQFKSGQAAFIYLSIEDAQGDLDGIDSSSGYQSIGFIDLTSPGGNQRISAEIMPSHRIDGDKFSGTYKVPIFLNESHESGKWSVVGIDIEDDAGNYYDIYGSGSWNVPATDVSISHLAKRLSTNSNSISFNYLNSNDYLIDVAAPILNDLSIESNNDELIVKLKISDLQGGVGGNDNLNSSGGYSDIGSLTFTSPVSASMSILMFMIIIV